MSTLSSSQHMPSDTPDTSPGPDETPPVAETAAAEPEEEIDDDTMALPLLKIKRIFKMDPDYVSASAGAVYATGVATELFVQFLVEHATMLAKMDKRKKIQYKDFSSAVASHDALYFLSDTIPKTQPVGEAMKLRRINVSEEDQQKHSEAYPVEVAEVADPAPEKKPLPKGQATLPFVAKLTVKKAGLLDLMSSEDMAVDP